MNTTILITDSADIKEKLQENLVLLRETDKLLVSAYENAPDVLYDLRPNIVILHENENREKTINLIKYLRGKKIFEKSNIVLYLNRYDRNFVLESYDEGVDDYILVESDPSEMLIRIINCIKRAGLNDKIKKYEYYLGSYGIIDSGTGFYSSKFSQEIFAAEIINGNFNNGSFMIIAPDEGAEKEFWDEKMIAAAIKKSIRLNDIVARYPGKYALLLKTGVEGAVDVFNKIKSELPASWTVRAGIAPVNSPKFADVEKKCVSALDNSLFTGKDYAIYSIDEQDQDDWLNEPAENSKNYKFFQKVFGQKLEKVITPVFYRMQKSYEEKLAGVKIEQYTDGQQSVFRLIDGKHESRLSIVYPGISKIIVYIVHSGLDSPENREVTMALNAVTQKEIAKLVRDFIDEFANMYINKAN